MKEALRELGKVFLDIAKYILTAVIFANIIAGQNFSAFWIISIISATVTVIIGLILITLSQRK